MIPSDELRHLQYGPSPGERTGGAGMVEIVAACDGDAEQVLARSREVLGLIVARQSDGWLALEEWRDVLPGWFTNACADEESLEETERWLQWWRRLPPEEQARAVSERSWSLANWLHWLQPEERQWFWWDAAVSGRDMLRVQVEVSSWPAPLGALEWLLRAAGGKRVSDGEVTMLN